MPKDGLGMLNTNSRAVPTTAVYINKSLQYVLAEMLRLAFLSPLHKQGYCSRTEISSSRSLRQAAHSPWKELYYKWLCTQDCWSHVLGSDTLSRRDKTLKPKSMSHTSTLTAFPSSPVGFRLALKTASLAWYRSNHKRSWVICCHSIFCGWENPNLLHPLPLPEPQNPVFSFKVAF